MEHEEEQPSSKITGDFFAVDARRWTEACADGLNSAVSYLVLCRGTGGDKRTTSWSVSAIEKYTGIARPRAQAAIDLHQQKGRLQQQRGGRHPKYWISPFGDDSTEPEWIWLPNAIIDGAASEVPPVELIRQTGAVKTLELFVDLYALHFLETEGGIDWRPTRGIRLEYFSEKISEFGEHAIWAFEKADVRTFSAFPPRSKFDSDDLFWSAWKELENLRLIFPVAHLIENDSMDGEIIHPLPYDTEGSTGEWEIAKAAHAAAIQMLAEWRLSLPDFSEDQPMVPAFLHLKNIALVGIYRLRYRPHTRATVKWLQKQADWAAYVEIYGDLFRRAYAKVPKENKRMQYQG